MQLRPQFLLRTVLSSIAAAFLLYQSPAHAELSGVASWYSAECCKYNPVKSCPMANGESLYTVEKQGIDFAASWHYPLNSFVRVTSLENGKTVVVKITDRGPAKRLHRVIDLSKKSFSQISNLKNGIVKVKTEALI